MGQRIPLFWTTSDISSGFQSQSGQPYPPLAAFPDLYLWYHLGHAVLQKKATPMRAKAANKDTYELCIDTVLRVSCFVIKSECSTEESVFFFSVSLDAISHMFHYLTLCGDNED